MKGKFNVRNFKDGIRLNMELRCFLSYYQALREIDELLKYLDKAENEINTAEPLSTDPETLAVQLRDHKVRKRIPKLKS